MGKYREMSEQALELIGGTNNISFVMHCATRLRISFKNKDFVKPEELKKLDGVLGVVEKPDQIQLIIGTDVNEAYHDFIEISGWSPDAAAKSTTSDEKHDFGYFVNKFGQFVAPVMMGIMPALIVGGMILAIRTLCINYFGLSDEGGTAQLLMAIFSAGFSFLPVYIGFTYARQLKMEPIMGAFLGAVMISESYTSGAITDFLGIQIPQVSYASTIIPVVLGVSFMYFVDKALKRIIPKALTYFLKPLATMVIVVPVTLIVLGPLGNTLSTYVGNFFVFLMDHIGFLAVPILAMCYPYMVMFGFDKALTPVNVELITSLGYDPITYPASFVSNIAIGASALAVGLMMKDKAQKGLISSAGVTGMCGVTEPAFYGGLITHPKALIGTAIGACTGGLFAGITGLRCFIAGGCPGLLTFLNYLDGTTGSFKYVILGIITAGITIAVSFIATMFIMKREDKKESSQVKETESSIKSLEVMG